MADAFIGSRRKPKASASGARNGTMQGVGSQAPSRFAANDLRRRQRIQQNRISAKKYDYANRYKNTYSNRHLLTAAVPKAAKLAVKFAFASRLLRLHPYFRVANFAYELLDAMHLLPWQKQQQGGYDFSGWTQTYHCRPLDFICSTRSPITSCSNWVGGSNSVWASGLGKFFKTGVGNRTYQARGFVYPLRDNSPISGFKDAQPAEVYTRTFTQSEIDTGVAPNTLEDLRVAGRPALQQPFPRPSRSYMPTLLPQIQPILNTGLEPSHVPYSYLPYLRFNPFIAWQYQRQVGHGGVSYHVHIPSYGLPYSAPPIVTSGSAPEKAAEVKPVPFKQTYHLRLPPRSRTKEGKMKVAFPLLSRGLNILTEGNDVINAVYQALPSEFKVQAYGGGVYRNALPQQKLVQLYKHFGELDMSQVRENIIQMQILDTVIGTVNKGAVDNWRQLMSDTNTPWAFGPARGSALRQALGDALPSFSDYINNLYGEQN